MSSSNRRVKDDHDLTTDPAIVAFRHSGDFSALSADHSVSPKPSKSPHVRSPSKAGTAAGQNQNASNNINCYVQRETGVIEKLLHSYGFIRCLEREARLFFHYSEFGGDADTMRTGEVVEFQQSSDRRTGKPIAVSVVRAPLKTSCEIMSEKPATGVVLAEAKSVKNKGSDGEAPSLLDGMGRIAYEQSGETFFLPFGLEDIELPSQKISPDDQVEFYISTDEKNGNIRARRVKVIKAASSNGVYQGVVCSLKDNYGFIERADIVKEIFFHFSEFHDDLQCLALGDDVQFAVQIRNNKEVAVNVEKLPEGTVIFEDIGTEKKRGKILKTLKLPQNTRQGDPLAGRIVYETLEGPIEIPFGDRDQVGDYTLRVDDIVEFNIATDRRDKLQRATNIGLSEHTFFVSKEQREKGYIVTLKEGYGFIRCTDREARMFFHYSELLDVHREIRLQQEVEFTVIQDPTTTGRLVAIRIRFLPKGTIVVEQYLPEKYVGTVEKEAGVTHSTPSKGLDPESPGIILYDVNTTKQTILFTMVAVEGTTPKLGDKVEFQICESRKNNTKNAISVKVISCLPPPVGKDYGYVAAAKDRCGLIEMVDHERVVSFRLKDGEPIELNVGDEVEFSPSDSSTKPVAENIRKLKIGTILSMELVPGVLDGKVVRMCTSELQEHFGLIQTGSDETNGACYTYGIANLMDKQEVLQKGDSVRFQLASVRSTGKRIATGIALSRRFLHARVDCIKGQTAFLCPDPEDGKKTSFRLTDVVSGGEISVGDEVEYILIQSRPNSKPVATNVRKISERQRPERLISRLKSVGDDIGPKMVVTRQPRGPDGTKGFKQPRKPWKPAPT